MFVTTTGGLHIQADLVPQDRPNVFMNHTSQLSRFLLFESATEFLDRRTMLYKQLSRDPHAAAVGHGDEIFLHTNIHSLLSRM